MNAEHGDRRAQQIEAELDRRLAHWASQRRIDDVGLSEIRAVVLRSVVEPQAIAVALSDAAPGFDTDWFWWLLRPVSDLIEKTGDLAESALPRRFDQWMDSLGSDAQPRPYLRLA